MSAVPKVRTCLWFDDEGERLIYGGFQMIVEV